MEVVRKKDEILIANGKWRFTERCGHGSFGEIYFGEHTKTGAEVAIKIEPLKNKMQLLPTEYEIYRQLNYR